MNEPLRQMLTLIGFIVLFSVALAFFFGKMMNTYSVQSEIEKSLLIYTLSSTINSMADVEEGYVYNELKNSYDIKIDAQNRLSIKEEKQKNTVTIQLKVPARAMGSLTGTKTVCVEKKGGEIIVKKEC
jgi:hypothetical protein